MTGILERIEAKLDQLLEGGNTTLDIVSTTTTSASTPTKVTSEMLTELLQPLVQSEDSKAKVKAVLTANGIGRLGEASESQYEKLYAEFKAIADNAASGGANDDLI
jgi:hypothetical protein